MPKRRRSPESDPYNDPEENVNRAFMKIGTAANFLHDVTEDIEICVSSLLSDVHNNRDVVIKYFINSCQVMPERIPLLASVVGLINARDISFGNEFVETLVRSFKEVLRSNQFEMALSMLRFFCCLVNCTVISHSSILHLFENFVEVTLEDRIPQVRSDWYVFAVLSTLPLVGKILFVSEPDRLAGIVATAESYISKRSLDHVLGLRVWDSDEPHRQEDYLSCLMSQIKNLQRQDWVEKAIWRPYDAFQHIFSESKSQKFAQITVPNHDEEESAYPMPRVVFRMFDYTDIPSEQNDVAVMPGEHTIERFLVEDTFHTIIDSTICERKYCSKLLLNYPFRVKLHQPYMITEVVLDKMFHLPVSTHLQLAYGVLLIELCRELPDVMPQILAQSVEMLFERLPSMKPVCIERFSNWFAYHLNNYKFQWCWSDWAYALEESHDSPRCRFIAETFQRLLRFSYYDYIKKIVPAEFSSLLPKPPGPINKYDERAELDLPGSKCARELKRIFQSRETTPADVFSFLKQLPSTSPEEPVAGMAEGCTNLKIDVFFTALFNHGSKTFTHAFALLNRFAVLINSLLRNQADDPCVEKQMEMLHVLFSVWKEQHQMMVVLVERLLACQLIEPEAIIKWIYSDEMQPHLIDFYIWEILHSSLRRVGKEVSTCNVELEKAKAEMASLRHKEDDLSGGHISTVEQAQLDTLQNKISELKEKRSVVLRTQLAVFSLALHRHSRLLENLPVQEDTTGKEPIKWRRWWLEGRMRQLLMEHQDQLKKYAENLHSAVFSKQEDRRVRQIFREFCALRS